jgi:hypothetical protein
LDCTIDLLNFRVLPRHACLLHRRCTFFIDQANKSEMAAPIILERFVLKRRFCERKNVFAQRTLYSGSKAPQ